MGDYVSMQVWGRSGMVRDFCSMAVWRDGYVIGGTLYHNHHPETGVIELTSAATSRAWLARPVVNAMFHLPFDMLGCQLCALRVSERNLPMISIARRFGFEETRIARLRGRDEAEMIFTITDDVWISHRMRVA